MPVSASYRPDPLFARLGFGFADPVEPADFPDPQVRLFDARAAARVGIETLSEAEKLTHFARFDPLPDNQAERLAIRYHGHQFRSYNPQIGDGRGFLFAQVRDDRGRLLDLGTKGSGRTPYSRTGDGRMTLQAGVREAIASAFLAATGVPTCAVLALVETGEPVARDDEPSPARGAVMTRLQHSHVRIGCFQRHAYEDRPDRVRALMDHAIVAYFPALASLDGDARVVAFLEAAIAANARLAARWMAAGYVHGVLNSDNMTVTGESFDYGPWRALPVYEPGFTAAYFDHAGLYAYARQPEATLWNLTRLAETLTLLHPDTDPLAAALQRFEALYQEALAEAVCARLGVERRGGAVDLDFMRAFFAFLKARKPWFEGALFDLFGGPASAARRRESPRARCYVGPAWKAFGALLDARTPAGPERLDHPYFAKPDPVRVTIDAVRGVWGAIAGGDDWAPLETLLADLGALGAVLGEAR